MLQVELTESGEEAVDEIIPCLFEYISMLHAQPAIRWIHEEVAGLSQMSFRFKASSPPPSPSPVCNSLTGTRGSLLSANQIEMRTPPCVQLISLAVPRIWTSR